VRDKHGLAWGGLRI